MTDEMTRENPMVLPEYRYKTHQEFEYEIEAFLEQADIDYESEGN